MTSSCPFDEGFVERKEMGSRVNRHVRIVGGMLATLAGTIALVLLTVEDTSLLEERDLAVPAGSHRIAMLQLETSRSLRPRARGFASAISTLARSEGVNEARMEQLVHSSWLQDIYGKDTTYDLDYIKNLPPGDVSEAGYEGLPKAKGVLPNAHEHALSDALLKHAIDTGTVPSDIENVWDGEPYVPSEEFKEKLSKAWGGFHQAVGEKRWEKKVWEKCGAGAKDPACAEVLGGKHEGYDTKWDGEEWTQWDGEEWKSLEPDE